MNSIITNSKDVPLSQNTGTLPNMADALYSWLQPMTFGVVTKVVENSQVVETKTDISFAGVWQPFTMEQLLLKPMGERSWKWFMVHSLTGLGLQTDDVVTYLGGQYRVMAKGDYNIYGYFYYELVNDYTGSGPA